MGWTAPYLLVAFAGLAAAEIWFVAAMAPTGRRRRAVGRRPVAKAPASAEPDLEFEDVGLLARGEKRRAEVALLRLCLDGRVLVDGRIVLAPGERLTEEGRRGGDARAAILDIVALIGVLVSLAVAGHQAPAAVVGLVAFGQWVVVTALATRLTGGQFQPLTTAGQEALKRARQRELIDPDDRMLLRTALRGLTVHPEFRATAEHGTPEAGLSPSGRHTSKLIDILQNLAELFTPGPGGGGR